jgi:hypothetical protein
VPEATYAAEAFEAVKPAEAVQARGEHYRE